MWVEVPAWPGRRIQPWRAGAPSSRRPIQWLSAPGTAGYPSYGPGDLWGCIGRWFSGAWYDAGAVGYISNVQGNLASRVWLGRYF